MQKLFSVILGLLFSGIISAQSVSSELISSAGDKVLWANEAGSEGYLNSDASLNGQSDNKDKNDVWVPKNEVESQVPQ